MDAPDGEPAPAADADGAEPEAGDPVEEGGDEEAAAASAEAPTGADGWAELHDVELPEAGTAVLTIDRQEFATDITCRTYPERTDDPSGVEFMFSLLVSDELDDGRTFQLSVNRTIAPGSQIDDLYETGGSSAFVVLSIRDEDGGSHTSEVRTPSDDDPQGARLPLVHVDPSGGITMQAEMTAFEGDAVVGDAVLAAQCPEPWSET